MLLLYSRDPARPTAPYWCTIGGAIEAGETPAQAASREMLEETGIAVPAGRAHRPVPSRPGGLLLRRRRLRQRRPLVRDAPARPGHGDLPRARGRRGRQHHGRRVVGAGRAGRRHRRSRTRCCPRSPGSGSRRSGSRRRERVDQPGGAVGRAVRLRSLAGARRAVPVDALRLAAGPLRHRRLPRSRQGAGGRRAADGRRTRPSSTAASTCSPTRFTSGELRPGPVRRGRARGARATARRGGRRRGGRPAAGGSVAQRPDRHPGPLLPARPREAPRGGAPRPRRGACGRRPTTTST